MKHKKPASFLPIISTWFAFLVSSTFTLNAQWNQIYTFSNGGPTGQLTSSNVHFNSPAEGYVFKFTWFSPSTGGALGAQKTFDYGTTWAPGFGFGNAGNDQFIGAQSISEDTTYVIISNIYDSYKFTFDRGATWSTNYLLGALGGVSSFFLINGQKGFVAMNAGINQIREISPTGDQVRFSFPSSTFQVSNMFFPSENTGYITVKDTTNRWLLLQTIDSGLNWHIQHYDSVGIYMFNDLYFINDSVGFIFIDNSLLKTIDAGQSFYPISIPTFQTIFDMIFLSDTLGYYISTNGAYCVSTDQGETWAFSAQVTGGVQSFQMFAPGFGYVMNNYHQLFRLEDSLDLLQFEDKSTLLAYPNPSTGTFYFKYGSNDSKQKMELYDMQGRLLIPSSMFTNPLHLHDFPTGNYLVKTVETSRYLVIVKR